MKRNPSRRQFMNGRKTVQVYGYIPKFRALHKALTATPAL